MKERFNLRYGNGIISAFITCFFFMHALIGAIYVIFHISNMLALIVWLGVSAVFVHIMACIGTSLQMLKDKERPPSQKKKMHLVLKWISGCFLAMLFVVHIALQNCSTSPNDCSFFSPMIILLICCLTWHAFVGIKSLVKDLKFNSALRNILRILVCCFAVLLIATVIISSI